jgi:hypothetical protein
VVATRKGEQAAEKAKLTAAKRRKEAAKAMEEQNRLLQVTAERDAAKEDRLRKQRKQTQITERWSTAARHLQIAADARLAAALLQSDLNEQAAATAEVERLRGEEVFRIEQDKMRTFRMHADAALAQKLQQEQEAARVLQQMEEAHVNGVDDASAHQDRTSPTTPQLSTTTLMMERTTRVLNENANEIAQLATLQHGVQTSNMGTSGLTNTGNFCYMNSVVQVRASAASFCVTLLCVWWLYSHHNHHPLTHSFSLPTLCRTAVPGSHCTPHHPLTHSLSLTTLYHTAVPGSHCTPHQLLVQTGHWCYRLICWSIASTFARTVGRVGPSCLNRDHCPRV